RRWRLDFRTMARGILPGKTRTGEGARLRRLKTHLDRDQRHILWLAKTRELSQMGARGTRWLCVFAEGTALCDQPPGAGGRRRQREAVLRFRSARAWRPARPGALAIRAHHDIRRSRFRR